MCASTPGHTKVPAQVSWNEMKSILKVQNAYGTKYTSRWCRKRWFPRVTECSSLSKIKMLTSTWYTPIGRKTWDYLLKYIYFVRHSRCCLKNWQTGVSKALETTIGCTHFDCVRARMRCAYIYFFFWTTKIWVRWLSDRSLLMMHELPSTAGHTNCQPSTCF